MIAVGTRLGRYEIRSPLGAGGMGEVYLAADAELNRPVALKFLPPGVAADEQRMARFIQEARAASALNHPNIITVYDIGQAGDGTRFLATEFVEGETLRERLNPQIPYALQFFDFATRRTTPLATLEGPRGTFQITSLTVSPDERFVLYTQRDQLEFDLMLVENFR
jgi:serine/threonine protein kinase